MNSNSAEIGTETKPFIDYVMDWASKFHPIVLMIILSFVFGILIAMAPSLTHLIVIALATTIIPGALDQRSRLAKAEVRLRETASIERVACAALQIAMARVEELESELAVARRQPDGGTADPVYRSVGLDADAPDYIVAAARRAHRVVLHPDRQSPENRQAAHERYVAVDAAFDEISRRRA